jgi:hypothetical protein
MEEKIFKQIVKHPDDVTALKAIAKICGKKEAWDFSIPDDDMADDGCSTLELSCEKTDGFARAYIENGRVVRLELFSSEISDLSPLAGLKSLTELHLNANRNISDLSPLAGLTELGHLELCDCEKIVDFSPLIKLPSLNYLSLFGANKTRDDLGRFGAETDASIEGLTDEIDEDEDE